MRPSKDPQHDLEVLSWNIPTKSLDGIKQPPKTNLEAWERWLNHTKGNFLTSPLSNRKKINVRFENAEGVSED